MMGLSSTLRNLGISWLRFAVSDRDGDLCLVIGDSVVLWDITSGNKVLIDAIPAGGAESVVFSPDGKLMTLAEEGGAVSPLGTCLTVRLACVAWRD